MKKIIYRNYTIKIEQDEVALNPREEFDNIGTMVCFHSRYNLGDKDHGFDKKTLINYLEKNKKDVIAIPLRLYDHSGITISTSNNYPYNDKWDSMMIGFIFITKETIRKEYNTKIVTKAMRKKVINNLEYEVELYNNYLTGSVYSYWIKDNKGDEIDSCHNFYGNDHEKSGLIECAKEMIDCEIKSKRKEHFLILKKWIHSKVNLQYRKPLPI